MTKARLIVDEVLTWHDGQFEAHIKVFKITKSLRFPDGIKMRCALLERQVGVLRLLMDNHSPFGYHIHSKLPENKNFRKSMAVRDHWEAIEIFLKECERIVNDKAR